MDVVTDQKMTSLVQSEFSSCTVLTIAHRLNTVLSCDRLVQSSTSPVSVICFVSESV